MRRLLTRWRHATLALILIALFVPLTTGAQPGVSCGDFANPDAAQALLDSDDSYADALDPDGDGVACNEDDDQSATGDAAYLDDIEAEIETLWDSFVRFDEIGDTQSDAQDQAARDALVDELNEIADMWLAYPEVAAAYSAPDAYERIEEAYQDLAATVGDAGELWDVFWAIPHGDEGEEDAFADFEFAYMDAQEGVVDLRNLIADARADDPAADEDADDAGSDEPADDVDPAAAEYLEDVRDHTGELVASGARLFELLQGDFTEDEGFELVELLDLWLLAPEEAAQLTPPDGYEDVQAAYEDVAAAYAASVDVFWTWIDGPKADADANLDAFIESVATAEVLAAELDALVTSLVA